MRILLIAGHGAGDSGAVAFGHKEAELARRLVPKIKSFLSDYECEVDIYDMQKSLYHELIVEGMHFDFKQYDYVLEVHFNAFKENADGFSTGSEVYVTRAEKIITVEENIVAALSEFGFKNRGVKRKDFDVIAEAKRQGVSAALLETCFIDDFDDLTIYRANENKIAESVADAIARGYKLQLKKPSASFRDISNHWAREYIEKLQKAGIVNGYADGTFRPDKPITRAEVAAMLARMMEKK